MDFFPQSNESVRDEILAHLNDKYGIEFTAIALERNYDDILYCYVQGGDPKADIVRAVRTTRDKAKEYRDTYFGIVIREEIEAEIMSVCSDISLPMQAFYLSNFLYYDNIFDGTKNYLDFKKWIGSGNSMRFTVTVILSLDDSNEGETYANQVYEKLRKAGFKGLAHVCFMPNKGFKNLTRTNLNDLIELYDARVTLFSESIN